MSIREIRDPNEFQKLCQYLLCAEYSDIQIVNDSAGDRGLDAYAPSTQTLYAMYCPEVMPRPKTRYLEKIRADLKKAQELRDQNGYRIQDWVFLTPAPLEEDLHRFIEENARQAGFTRGLNQSEPHLLVLLSKHPHLHTQFPRFVIPDLAKSLEVGFASLTQHVYAVGGQILRSLARQPGLRSNEPVSNSLLMEQQPSSAYETPSFSTTERYFPTAISDFVGRVKLLDELAATESRMVVITGISGSGKSALLGQLTIRKERSFIFAYKFYPGLHSLADLLNHLSQFLGQRIPSIPSGMQSLQNWSAELIEALNQRDYWLVFDDADFINTDPAYSGFFTLLKEHLRRGTVFLAAGTRPSFLTPLDEAKQQVRIIELEGLTEEEVSAYLRGRGFAIESQAIQEIAADLAGMPLALELLSLLAAPNSNAEDLCRLAAQAKEKTVDHLANQVFSRLSQGEQEMLTIAALFSFPFCREELIEVYQRIAHHNGPLIFMQLRRQSLLRAVTDELYEVQTLIGTTAITYAVQDLTQQRLAAANYLIECESAELLPQLNALEMYREARAYDQAAEVAISLIDDGLMPYTPTLARTLIDSFRQEQVSAEQWLWLLGERGSVAHAMHEDEQAEACFREMSRLAEAEGNKAAQAIALQRLGILYYDRNKQTAEQFYEQSLALKNELNDLAGQAQIYNNLGLLYQHWGDPERAQTMLEKGLEIHQQLVSPEWQCLSLYSNLGILAARQQHWDQAYHYSGIALRIAQESDSPYEIARAIFNLGRHDFERGEIEKAQEQFQQVLATAEDYQLADLQELVYCALARLCLDAGYNAQGIEYLQRIAALQQSFHNQRKLAGTYCDLGTAFLRQEDFAQCLHYYHLGVALFEHLTDHDGIDTWLANIVSLCQAQGEENAIRKLITGLKIQRRRLRKRGVSYCLARVCGALGRIRLQDDLYDKITITYFTREIEMLSQLDRQQEQIDALMNLGQLYQERGVFSKAISTNLQALQVAEDHNLRISTASLSYNLANCYVEVEDYDAAISYYQQALQIALEIQDVHLQQSIEHNLGEALRRAGRFAAAIEKLSHSLQMAEKIDDVQGQGLALNNLGLAYQELARRDEAKNAFTEALARCRQHQLLAQEANVLISFGNFYYQDDPGLARQYYDESFKTAVQAEDFAMEEKAMLSLMFVGRKLGVVEEMQEEFKRVAERAQRLGHYAIFVEFLTLAGEINLDEKKLPLAAEMFEYALLFALLLLVQRGEGENDPATEPLQVIGILRYKMRDLVENNARRTAREFQQELRNRLMQSPYLRDFTAVIEEMMPDLPS